MRGWCVIHTVHIRGYRSTRQHRQAGTMQLRTTIMESNTDTNTCSTELNDFAPSRKMAYVAEITQVIAIPDADRICQYEINAGWKVVDQVGKYTVGDLVIYFEIDSWIPTELAPFMSKGNEPRVYNEIRGEKLRTIRLKKALSQGLILPIPEDTLKGAGLLVAPGLDLTAHLGIQKWEAPVSAQLAGMARGNFPSWGKKTDAERIQNLSREFALFQTLDFEVTIKLDGSSMSVGISPDGEYVVCSRNLSLKTDQEGNSFVDVAAQNDLERKLRELDRPLMVQGELIGPGVQGNQEKLSAAKFFVFNIWDPTTASYLPAIERTAICNQLGINHTPVLHERVKLVDIGITTIDEMLNYADGPSLNPSVQREGLVFKSISGEVMFKAISNKWLLTN